MALDPARVVKPHPIPEELLCTICTGVLLDPVEGPCEHLACRECLDGWFQQSKEKTCPTCRQPLADCTIKPGHRAVRSQLDAFEVTCDNATRGCTAVINLGVLPGHLSSCGKGIEICSNSGCVATVLREDLAKHLQACPHRIVSCRRCDAKIKHQNEQMHLQQECPGVEVHCQHNGGCGQTVRRDAMAAHIDTECSRAIVTCEFPGCQRQMARGAMKEHLDTSQVEHMTSLVRHVASLSLELQQAKSKITEQGAELERLKAQPLGPAFRCTVTLHDDGCAIKSLAASDGVLYSTTGQRESTLRVWNLYNQRCERHLGMKDPSFDYGGSTRLMVENGVLYIISNMGIITWNPPDYQFKLVWESSKYARDVVISQGKIYGTFRENNLSCLGQRRQFLHRDFGVLLASDGAKLYDDRFQVWDMTTKKLVIKPTTNGVTLEGIEVKHLALGNGVLYGIDPERHTIRAWSTVDYTHIADIRAPRCHLTAAGGGFLFAATSTCNIKVWSTKDYSRLVTELTEHRTQVTALHVHDGMLFSGSEDGQIKIWRIPTC
eukprot:jgi/Mesvir1/12311/Mv00507-RA.2